MPSLLWPRRVISELSVEDSIWFVSFKISLVIKIMKMQNLVSYIITSRVKVPKSDKDYDLRVPKDMAYIFSGAYITLSCKLIEQVRKAVRDRFSL